MDSVRTCYWATIYAHAIWLHMHVRHLRITKQILMTSTLLSCTKLRRCKSLLEHATVRRPVHEWLWSVDHVQNYTLCTTKLFNNYGKTRALICTENDNVRMARSARGASNYRIHVQDAYCVALHLHGGSSIVVCSFFVWLHATGANSKDPLSEQYQQFTAQLQHT